MRAATVLVTILCSGKGPEGKVSSQDACKQAILFSFLIFPLTSKNVILQRQVLEEGREGDGGIRRERVNHSSQAQLEDGSLPLPEGKRTHHSSRPLSKPEQGIKLLGAGGTY